MKQIAVITTVYRYLSHAQHMADRLLVGYPHNGEWHRPDMKVASLYVDQKPPGDQSAQRAPSVTVAPLNIASVRGPGEVYWVRFVVLPAQSKTDHYS